MALAQHSVEKLVADGNMKGPTTTSNYIVPGQVIIGDTPTVGSERLRNLQSAGVNVYVDLRDKTSSANYLSGIEGAEYVSFPFHTDDYGARQSQKQFLYGLLDRINQGQKLYIHDATGHGRCGVVGACLLSAIYSFPGMKSLNMIAQLHALRDNTEGSDCPVDSKSNLKAYVKEVVRELSYKPGSGGTFAAGAPAPQVYDSPSRASSVGGASKMSDVTEEKALSGSTRFASSTGKSGGGHTSINIFGGGGADVPTPGRGRMRQTPQSTPVNAPQPSPPQASRGKSSGGGVSQVNLFGGDMPTTTPQRVPEKATPPPAYSIPPAEAPAQQQHHTPTTSPGHAPSEHSDTPLDAHMVSVQMSRPSTDVQWGFVVTGGVEITHVASGSIADRCGVPTGLVCGVDSTPIESEADLRHLAGRTSMTLHVIPNVTIKTIERQPGESWGIVVDDLWIIGIHPGSPAAAAGIPTGKLVYINGVVVRSMEDCRILSEVDEVEIGVQVQLPEGTAKPAPLPSSTPVRSPEAPQAAPKSENVGIPTIFDTKDKTDLKACQGPTRNSNWVIRGRLLVGAAPDPRRPADLQALLDAGVTTFVNLRASDEKSVAYVEAVQKMAKRPVNFMQYHMQDGTAPSEKKQILEFVEFVKGLIDKVHAGETLYIHCRGGHGRSGMVVACMLGAIYHLPSMKALNMTDTLHSTRADAEDQCSPQTQEQRIFVLDVMKNHFS